MDSPQSETTETRFGTPVSDLDDHRHQSPIPMANTASSSRRGTHVRRDTATSTHGGRPDMLQVDEMLREDGPVSRDFEHVVIDDDRSRIDEAVLSDQALTPRRTISYRIPDTVQRAVRSKDRSSSSSRSSSPPNSIDAFANGRRRERANTFGSRHSDLDLNLQRTISGGTHRRRPTFSNASIKLAELQDDDIRPEEDVCFPQAEEPTKTFKIDFEELEEFVADSTRGRPPLPVRQRHSFSSQGYKPKDFHHQHMPAVPKIVTQAPSPMGRVTGLVQSEDEDNDFVKDETTGFSLLEVEPSHTRGMSRISITETTRFSFFSSEIEQTVHAPELGDLLLPGQTFRDLFELPVDSGAWWLDVQSPTEDELEMFQKGFGIHRLTVEDIQSQEPREKVELFKQYYFVCFRSFYQMDKNSDRYLDPLNVYMVVFRDGIITFTYAPSPHAVSVRKRIGTLRNFIDLTADWICYAMVYVLPFRQGFKLMN